MSSDEASAKAGDLQELKRLRRLHDHKEKLKDLGFKEVDMGDLWVEKTCKEAARAGTYKNSNGSTRLVSHGTRKRVNKRLDMATWSV